MTIQVDRRAARRQRQLATPVKYGAAIMIALSFANALQNGESAAFGQAIDSFEKAFHVSDATIGTVTFIGGAALYVIVTLAVILRVPDIAGLTSLRIRKLVYS